MDVLRPPRACSSLGAGEGTEHSRTQRRKPRTAVTAGKQRAGREGAAWGGGTERQGFVQGEEARLCTVTLILGKASPCFNAAGDRAVEYLLLVLPEGRRQLQCSPCPYGTEQISCFQGDVSVSFSSVFVFPLCVLCRVDRSLHAEDKQGMAKADLVVLPAACSVLWELFPSGRTATSSLRGHLLPLVPPARPAQALGELFPVSRPNVAHPFL